MLAGVIANQALYPMTALPALLPQHCNPERNVRQAGDRLSAGMSLLKGQELDLERGSGDMETVVAKRGSTGVQLLHHEQTQNCVWWGCVDNPKQRHCLLRLPFAYRKPQISRVRFQTTNGQTCEVPGVNL